MSKSSYKINTKLIKDKPFVNVEMSYKDIFYDDNYLLSGHISEGTINFSVTKNKNKKLNETSFSCVNGTEGIVFINELSESVNDYDFIEDFKKNHLQEFAQELSEFIIKCDSSMISEGKIFEGYKDKLKRMSGVIGVNENLR
tara:strand:+ start:2130 stop:2555 length:426 start_codon:yes stop_codon:yes gene_type:complete